MIRNREADVLRVDLYFVALGFVQQRGDRWLRADGYADRSTAIRALEQATITADGALGLQSNDLAILATRDKKAHPLVTSLFKIDDGLTVETATATSPLLINLDFRDAVPLTVRGHAGWLLTKTGQNGSDYLMVSWMETSDRMVMVYGQATNEQILAVADALVAVDYRTWIQAVGTPGTTATTPTSGG